ncbi:MAG: hypothetical protein sL5_09480 [Candidatus Mesenet longicola]|uniref:Uncharacterized protein n=1 Tax=Candidatus Mesenet longicola TaxID=1892558 RepID=A0A8J3HVK9_9RICK|nr:MAG: hypothetical protein sGL2_09980 [Candidatus Mesenet longicola]GHM59955.1 MAG: hypothetical protein sL5_09480 [Candidatus Mesenet longicola]
MKIRKEQDNFYSKKILNGPSNPTDLKNQIQKKAQEIKKMYDRLLLDLQMIDNCTIVYQNLFLKEAIRRREKQEDYKSADEIVEYFCTNTQMVELTVEEVMTEAMDDMDKKMDLSTIDQILSKKENMDSQGKPKVLDQLTVGDLIEDTLNQVYS